MTDESLETTVEEPEFNFATIGAIYADGVSLIFDGQTEATEKHYKVNTALSFAAGNRVKIIKDSGTYVVEYVVGNPGTGSAAKCATATTAATATHATTAGTATDAQKLGGSTASDLSVKKATYAIDQADTSRVISFRYYNNVFQCRVGSASWVQISN